MVPANCTQCQYSCIQRDEISLAKEFGLSRTPARERLTSFRRVQLRARNRISQSLQEHEEIVQAILAGDGDLAAQRIRNYIVIQSERFADVVASLATHAAT